MKIHKPDNLSLLFSPFRPAESCCMSVAALACFSFDTSLTDRLLAESVTWQTVAGELGGEEALDMGHPKRRGEFLAYGSCYLPHAAAGAKVSVTVAGVSKTLNVTGARHWNSSGLPSAPVPFREMRIGWNNAFGGPGFEQNPVGIGIAAEADGTVPLPRIQHPDHLATSPGSRPEPAGFSAIPPFWPQRKQYLGKFDEAWLKKRWPHYPLDTDPEYFNTAPQDQRLAGFFTGDEPLRIVNMHPEKPEIISRLPEMRARLFISRLTDGQENFSEISARPESLWLFPGSNCGILLFRGVVQVSDETLDDVTHLMAEWEPLNSLPESLEFYHRRFLGLVNPTSAGLSEPSEPSEAEPVAAPSPVPPVSPPPAPEPPVSPEEAKLLAELNEMTARLEARADAVFARLGMTREEAMEKYLPKQQLAPEPSMADLEKMSADLQQKAEAALKEMGMTLEEAARKYFPPPPEPADPQQVVKTVTDALMQLEARLKDSGINMREVAAKHIPDADPAMFDIPSVIAGLGSLAAELAPKTAQSAAPPEEPGVNSPQPDATPDQTDETGERIRQGKNFSGMDLSGMDFSGRDLAGADFSSATLAKAKFAGANLAGALFTDAVMTDADFSRTCMEQTRLVGVQAADTNFTEARMKATDLSKGDFTGCTFNGGDLSAAMLSGASFADASLKDVSAVGLRAMGRTTFSGADLSGADLTGAVVTAADFTRAIFDRTIFREADASRADFGGATGSGTDFSGAKMTGTRAGKGTRFVEALFSGADLSRSCWERACFSGGRMDVVILDHSDFSRVVFERVTMVNATARETNFMKTSISCSDLRGVNFFKASFRHARISECDLKSSSMFATDLYGAKIVKSDVAGTDFRRAQGGGIP